MSYTKHLLYETILTINLKKNETNILAFQPCYYVFSKL
jgi:hypothetical protein